jgi:CRISPR-associated protein (TIGR03986 family)
MTMPLNAISAPYNFVPLSDWVHCPDWADRVSHDNPFRDGFCGHLDLKITAVTPVLVGREQQKASNQAPGRVEPYRLPDNRYALPGTALKGMIRNVVEIATFSRMGAVDDVRYGLRDISGPYVKASYTAKVRDCIQTGFMGLGGDGLPRITPCAMVRLDHRALEAWLGVAAPVFRADRSVKKKYARWAQVCSGAGKNPTTLSFAPTGRDATELAKGKVQGVPVFTGQISDSTKKHGKRRDFVFYDERPSDAFAPTRQEWNDFLFVHGDQAGKDAGDMSWPGYWNERYWRGEPVPVFYLRDGDKTRIGLAYMPRLAGDFSVHEMRDHTSAEHGNGQGRGPMDFAEVLFGTVGETPEDCLKGRVTFHHAIAEGSPRPQATDPTILNGPKASYFPNYLKQKAGPDGRLRSNGYATCLATDENPRPELRGWKRYPARPEAKAQPLTDEQVGNKKVQVGLNPLPAGTVFTTRVDFHNLRPVELGALCWALTWGGAEGLRHSLGMGKPFGFGQLAVKITGSELVPNRPDGPVPTCDEAREAFIAYMDGRHYDAKGTDWRVSPQIKTLLGMADPDRASQFKGELRHMRLEAKEFTEAKRTPLVLAEYPPREHPETLAQREAAEKAEAERRQEELRQAQMTEEDRKIEELERLFGEAQRFGKRKPGDRLGQRFNTIAEEAKGWPQDRKDRLILLLEKISKFLEGDAKKRRARIDALRGGGDG